MTKLNKNFMARNITLMTDLYELTMAQGYFKHSKNEIAVFDMFFRTIPDDGGYCIAAGLESVIEFIQNIRFEKDDIEYLRNKGFDEDFLSYLENFKFTGTIEAVPEGTVVFPMEPLIKVIAPLSQAQFVETTMLSLVNHQTLIATKASRICYAAGDQSVIDFGLRRAHNLDAGNFGARAAIIAGCKATSDVYVGKTYGVNITGTMAHSWVESFDSEYEAFMAYANTYNDNIILLIDTYDTIKGAGNAIKVFEVLKKENRLPNNYGVRLDSGDLAYLSKKVRNMLDEAGFVDAKVCASNDLDERSIQSLKQQGAKIDVWAAGTKLITSYTSPTLGGVYKLSAIERNGSLVPKIKLSENEIKITNPGNKTLYRVIDKASKKFIADIIALADETFDENESMTIYDPEFPRKRKVLQKGTYTIIKLHKTIFKDGELVYDIPEFGKICSYCKEQLNSLWEEVRRFDKPHKYYVDLSDKLYDLKKKMIYERGGE